MDPFSSTTGSSTSSSLLRRVQASDPEAWRTFTCLYGPVVYSWARQTGLQGSDAADVMQETFRTLVGRVSTFRKENPGDSLRGWLWTITRNKIRDHFRRVASRPQAIGGTDARALAENISMAPPDEVIPTDDISQGLPVSEAFVNQQVLSRIQGEFEPRTWRAFWEVTVNDRRPADIAGELGMSLGAVYMAKSRVLKRLRLEMGG